MKKRRTKFKPIIFGLTAISASLIIGLGSACSSGSTENGTDDGSTVTQEEDTQVIKNGNFEFYSDNDGKYVISNPNNWTSGSRGTASNSMSGVINTRPETWNKLTDPEFPAKLEANNKLDSKDEDKVDYNGVLTDDMPFINPHKATEDKYEISSDDYIANPMTHKYSYDADGNIKDSEGKTITLYQNEDDKEDKKYYYDDGDAGKTVFESSVLMIHNYCSASNYLGTESYFTSSTDVELEAGTVCAISLWVKTSNLSYDANQTEQKEVTFDRGAYISVASSVGGSKLDDSFIIKNINTEVLNPTEYDSEGNIVKAAKNNGWIQYTIYVEASSFANTSVTLTLGLGKSDNDTVEGYAFFDDITFEKYRSKAKLIEAVNDKANDVNFFDSKITADNTCLPLESDPTFEYRVDTTTGTTNNGSSSVVWTEENNSKDRHFFIDFASTNATSLNLNENSVKAGLTVDDTKYVCASPDASSSYAAHSVGTLDNDIANAKVPKKLGDGVKVSDDMLATFNISSADTWSFPYNTYDQKLNKTLTEKLSTAASLPEANGNTSALFILSAYGASYEAEIYNSETNGDFALASKQEGNYLLISFWVKSYDISGNEATIKVISTDPDSEDSQSFTVNSAAVSATDFDENDKDIYNGWVRCFVRVANNSEKDQSFKIVVNYGTTSIKATDKQSYSYGWIAVANLSVSSLEESVYNYTSNVSRCATLTFEDEIKSTNQNFDDTKSNSKNDIKTNIALPSSYSGVNGNSKKVNSATEGNFSDYDKNDVYEYAGLINKNYIGNYKELLNDSNSWFSILAAKLGFDENTSDEEIWNLIARDSSVEQPLLIINQPRTFNENNAVYNYGYIGNNTTLGANSYTSVSVRVKVSANAVATIYLVDSTDSHGVMSYETPEYSFWYDNNGNILKTEPQKNWSSAQKKENIAYTLRDDGLYERDGKLYANLYNLTTFVDKYSVEDRNSFYKADGTVLAGGIDAAAKAVNNNTFLDMVSGRKPMYFDNTEATAYAHHYLVASDTDNTKIFKYCSGTASETCYYYMENGKPNTTKKVYALDTSYAVLRYNNPTAEATPYQFTINTTTAEGQAKYADKWVTVSFNVRTGSQTKNYRLELWSGYRSETTTDGVASGSYVMFDYSSISLDESTYNSWLSQYTDAIITDYKEEIVNLKDNDANIAELEKLAGVNDDPSKRSAIYDSYSAKYFTYSFYDSSTFVPFNKTTADSNQLGYPYNYSDYDEALALFSVVDSSDLTMAMFVNYDTVDKEIKLLTTSEDEDSSDDTDNSDDSSSSGTNVWLLAASIALVVAIVIAMVAIILKDFFKKHKRKGKTSKNSYNFKKNKRYVKQYVKANGEAPEITDDSVDKSLLTDEVAEEKAEETTAPAEDAPVEDTSAPVEDVHAEETVSPANDAPNEETPAEEAPAPAEDDKSDDGENKE